jgi:hypothetical protein
VQVFGCCVPWLIMVDAALSHEVNAPVNSSQFIESRLERQ